MSARGINRDLEPEIWGITGVSLGYHWGIMIVKLSPQLYLVFPTVDTLIHTLIFIDPLFSVKSPNKDQIDFCAQRSIIVEMSTSPMGFKGIKFRVHYKRAV